MSLDYEGAVLLDLSIPFGPINTELQIAKHHLYVFNEDAPAIKPFSLQINTNF